jgi:RNA polymerase sigma factor (sigma-70 family)
LRLRSDDQLLVLFRRGSDEAFTALVDRYRTRLLAYTRRMLGGSQADAEDALQDVFLRAYGALRADERPVSVRAWLYRVAHNRCIDQIRRAGPAPEDILAASRGTGEHDPATAYERREDLRQVVSDIGDLPQAQRSALLLREIDGLSYNELAAALDMTLPAVKSVLVRARTSLAESGEARATPCAVIRLDLATAHDDGVRPDGRARRHMRECDPCRDYQTALRGPAGAHSPTGPFGFLAKLLGLGSAPVGGGAAVGGMATGKVAALVCCGVVAVGAGAAAELPQQLSSSHHAPAVAHARSASDSSPSSKHALTRALHLATVPAAAAAAASATAPHHTTPSTPASTPSGGGIVRLRSSGSSQPQTSRGAGHDSAVTSEPTEGEPTVDDPSDTDAGTDTGTTIGADGRPTTATGTDTDDPGDPATDQPSTPTDTSTPTQVGSDGRPIGTGSSVGTGSTGSSSSSTVTPPKTGTQH